MEASCLKDLASFFGSVSRAFSMKRLLILLIAVFPCYCFSASVWKITSDKHSLYIGGTLHLLSQSDYPLPQAYHQAFERADTLVFETNIGAFNTPEFAAQSVGLLMYPEGKRLQDELSEDTQTALRNYLSPRGMSLADVERQKPALLSITLSLIALREQGLTGQGIDSYYYERAKSAGKTVAWFETPLEQLNFIAGMGGTDPDAFIQYTLSDIASISDSLSQLKQDWKSGDLQSLARTQIHPLNDGFPQVYQSLLVARNQHWLVDIEAMLKTPETEFVLVGLLHLAGDDGLLARLKEKGFTVEPVSSDI